LQPRWDISGNHRDLLWKHGGISPSAGFYKDPRGRRYFFGGWPEILDGDQVLLLRV
jgi:hypothetical protein